MNGAPQVFQALEVRTLDQLARLDEKQMVEGYMFGFGDQSRPIPDGATPSFLHGYNNALCDRGYMRPTNAMQELARHFVGAYRGLN